MGVTISHTTLAPISVASIIIGFASFGFTLGTFLKVVWVNLETLGEAPHEVHAYLTNLRTELLEERANLKTMRKGIRKHQRAVRREGREDFGGVELDEVSMRTMNDSVKGLIKRFKELEKPFLEEGERGIGEAGNHRRKGGRRNSSFSPPAYGHAAYSSPPEKNHRSGSRHGRDQLDEEADEEAYWAQRTKYARFTLWKRMKWLSKKPQAQYLFETLTRVQVRRIALQVGGLSVCIHNYGTETLELRDTVRRIDDRVSRLGVGRRNDQ